MKWLLYKVDRLIHKAVPHPPCTKMHIDVTTPLGWTSTSTANINPAVTHTWTLRS